MKNNNIFKLSLRMFFTFVLILILFIFTGSLIVHAEPTIGENFKDNTSGLSFIITSMGDNNTVEVTEYDNVKLKKKQPLTVPETVEYQSYTFKVTSIGSWVFFLGYMTEVTLPEGLLSIGERAFEGCDYFTNISIPSTVTTIGNSVFSGCETLKNVTLPEGLTSIGNRAFEMCDIENITIPSTVTSIGEYAFYSNDNLAIFTCEASVPPTLQQKAFLECSQDLKIKVPEQSVSLYQQKAGWSNYADKIEGYHIHSISASFEQLDSKCTEAGHEAYYECECGTYFSDEELTKPIDNLNAWLSEVGEGYIAPLGHSMDEKWKMDGDYHWHQCTRCDFIEDKAEHIFNYSFTVTKATCFGTGKDVYTCSCGAVITKTTQALGHDMTHHEASNPTCTEDGNVEYWTCSHEDGVYYADENCISTLDSIVVPKLGHDMTHHEASNPTCTEDGTVEYWTCSHESGIYYADENGTTTLDTIVDPKLGHDMTHHEASAPSFTEDGTVEYWTCSHESGIYYADEDGTRTLDTIVNPKLTEEENNELSTGAIVGIVAGSVVLLSLIGYAVMFIIWKKKNTAIPFLVKSFKWINKSIFKK